MLKKVFIAGLALFYFCLPRPIGAKVSDSASPTPFIVVDRFGYLPDAKKVAIIRDPVIGFDSQWHFAPGNTYQVINVETGAVVFEGMPVAWHSGAVDPSSGDRAWQFDFSGVVAPGRYLIRDKERDYDSVTFSVAANLYKPLLVQAVRMLFYQRAGFTKKARYAGVGWADKASQIALQETHSAAEYRNTLSTILEEAARLNETIDSLLLLARAESTQPGDRQSVFPVLPLVHEVLNLLEVLIDEQKIQIVEESSSIDNPQILGDRALLRVAVLNILHNAIKLSPPNSSLMISYEIVGSPHSVLQITFQDQGPGITPGDEERVFERFFTRTIQSQGLAGGSGLGLAIAKLVIERTGGTIRFDKNVETGAKCIVSFPQ